MQARIRSAGNAGGITEEIIKGMAYQLNNWYCKNSEGSKGRRVCNTQ